MERKHLKLNKKVYDRWWALLGPGKIIKITKTRCHVEWYSQCAKYKFGDISVYDMQHIQFLEPYKDKGYGS